jgi:transcription initiation factor IIE alpha subunit
MNIFKKIALANKIAKTVKAVKQYLDSTHIDDELKEILLNLKTDIQKLIEKVPETKELVIDIMDLIK